jgi:hypothetical protein
MFREKPGVLEEHIASIFRVRKKPGVLEEHVASIFTVRRVNQARNQQKQAASSGYVNINGLDLRFSQQ